MEQYLRQNCGGMKAAFVVPLGVLQTSATEERQKPMVDIIALLVCLHPVLPMTTIRQFSRIALTMLAMTGRVTMLGIARWTGDGGSYRTVQRFFTTVIPWAVVFWHFFRVHVFNPADVYLLAGDECVVTKAGKHTHGLDRFFASLYGKPVPGLAFFTLSLISTQQRRSFPIQVEQVVRSAAEKAAAQAKKPPHPPSEAAPKRTPGRPKGRTTAARTEVTLTPELHRLTTMVHDLLGRINGLLPLRYLVLDGHFGTNTALQMTRQNNLHLISKLRADSALYQRYTGPYAGRGPRRKYGAKIDYAAIPACYLRQTSVADGTQTRIYQLEALHKTFAQPLNVVIIVKTNLHTQARAHVVLFSSDLALPWDQLIDYYGLRFQLEFNFRDAKQYWGLEDFMNTSPTAVTNAANLALFMVNVAYRLLQDFRQVQPEFSVLDLKAHCRGLKYVEETIKLLPEKPEPDLLVRIATTVVGLGRIHAAHSNLIAA
jgi:putative transposase